MDKYVYSGPVFVFDNCVMERFEAETMATTEKKARSNIAFQFKKRYGYTGSKSVSLPGKLKKFESEV